MQRPTRTRMCGCARLWCSYRDRLRAVSKRGAPRSRRGMLSAYCVEFGGAQLWCQPCVVSLFAESQCSSRTVADRGAKPHRPCSMFAFSDCRDCSHLGVLRQLVLCNYIHRTAIVRAQALTYSFIARGLAAIAHAWQVFLCSHLVVFAFDVE